MGSRLVRTEPLLHVVLVHPEIAPNTGNAGRLCVAVGARLHLVHPLGFRLDDKAVRRAGLDYWSHVDLQEHADLDAFLTWAEGRRLHLFSAHGRASFTQARFELGDVLVFGCESVGLPRWLVAERGAWRIPLIGPVRSLNLSNAVAISVYRALQEIAPARFEAAEDRSSLERP